MWDDGALNAAYHYLVADDGIRPYEPLMDHDKPAGLTTTGTNRPL